MIPSCAKFTARALSPASSPASGVVLLALFWAAGIAGLLAGRPLETGWEYYRGDLGGTWEALRVENSSRLPVWTDVTLPHSFNGIDAVHPDVAYYQGPGWYRRTLAIENPYRGGRTFLRFDGAGQKTEVYLGDRLVGRHVGGYDEFTVELTEALREGGFDLAAVPLLVRCDNSRDLEMIPSDLSDFNLYGGLYRPVHLIYRPALALDWPVIDASVDAGGRAGTLRVSANLLRGAPSGHEASATLRLWSPEGELVAEKTRRFETAVGAAVSFFVELDEPALWSPSSPRLYRWEVAAGSPQLDGIDSQSGNTGFRHFEFREKGPFFLNGERLLLRGVHRHEDHAGVAAAMTAAQLRDEMELMKSVGFNFIRLGHYQQSREVLELCDELGLLVYEEIPWCRGGLGGESYREQARRMLTNMITQHRHHPSVIIWGLGNENDWPGDFPEFDKEAIRAFMSELNDLAHALDPSRVTCIRRCAFCADIVDVYSPSIWAGWYRGKYTDYREVSRREMEKVDRFIHVEWGASHHPGRHSEDPDEGLTGIRGGAADERSGDYLMTGGDARVSRDSDWTVTYACNLIDWHLKEQENMPWLTGTAYWPFKDFSTPIRPENPVPYVNQKGIVERDLTPKETFYVFQSYWAPEPMVHIYGHTWPVRWGAPGEGKLVKVYSNCPEVELFHNGNSLGRRTRDSQNFPAAGLRWEVPMDAGEQSLRAVAYVAEGGTIEDSITLEYQTETWEEPAQLTLEVIEESATHATVQVYARDEKGVRCLDAKQFVRFSLVGGGELIVDLGVADASRKVQLANGRAQVSLRKGSDRSILCVQMDDVPAAFLEIAKQSVD